ncbi:YlbF family regulator [Caryophanon latum]|uniref:Uncharacterized protein n=1 Tax=Caryophanon latum TaxID=33977 RepID=A0A1C0YFS3_9BACL|nr:YlbF family regulator [Caryophanon latum]OCS86015.1 hypothetical protein A6K76_14885 [Caryophanon latum]
MMQQLTAQLQQKIKETEQFVALERAIEAVKEDAQALALFTNFRDVQVKLQEKQMQGEQLLEDELLYAQQVAQLAQQNEKILYMLDTEMELSRIIESITRELVQPIQAMYESM